MTSPYQIGEGGSDQNLNLIGQVNGALGDLPYESPPNGDTPSTLIGLRMRFREATDPYSGVRWLLRDALCVTAIRDNPVNGRVAAVSRSDALGMLVINLNMDSGKIFTDYPFAGDIEEEFKIGLRIIETYGQ
ncbi:MAG: hypothetical protein V4702_02755 [Patescibacteria group bacterium]